MEISAATASSLGNKLADLELSDEEGVLLAALVAGSHDDEDEVQGFAQPTGKQENPRGYTEVEWTYRKNVLGALPAVWKQPGGDGYLVITMTN